VISSAFAECVHNFLHLTE